MWITRNPSRFAYSSFHRPSEIWPTQIAGWMTTSYDDGFQTRVDDKMTDDGVAAETFPIAARSSHWLNIYPRRYLNETRGWEFPNLNWTATQQWVTPIIGSLRWKTVSGDERGGWAPFMIDFNLPSGNQSHDRKVETPLRVARYGGLRGWKWYWLEVLSVSQSVSRKVGTELILLPYRARKSFDDLSSLKRNPSSNRKVLGFSSVSIDGCEWISGVWLG